MLKIQIMDMLLPWLLKTGGKLLITVLLAVIGYKVCLLYTSRCV